MTTNTPEFKTTKDCGTGDGTAMHDAACAAGRAGDALNAGIESGRQAIEGAKEAVEAGYQAAQQRVGVAMGMARETAAQVSGSVAGAAAYAGQRAEEATSSVGGALENTGHYLKDDGLRHIASDLTDLVRRNPVPAMLIGVGLGFLLAQATVRRNP